MSSEALVAVLGMAVVSYACRAGGFWVMRYVPLSGRVRAWLNGIPMAIMGAVLAPAAVKGGPPEWLGLAVTFLAMKTTGNDLLAVAAGVAVVAVARAYLV